MNDQNKIDINVKPISREDWREFCAMWEKSGESQSKFCNRHGLNKHSFTYWRSIFTAENKCGRSKALTPVTIKPGSGCAVGLSLMSIKIQSPTGYVISVPTELEKGLLSRLLKQAGFSDA